MKVLVCVSNVPDTTTKVTFTNDNMEFNTAGVQFIINPYDEIALARAIELTEDGKGTVTIVNVGKADTEPTIRKALAIGADDAVRIDATPSDAYFVSYNIAEYARDKNFDLILTGRESIDYNGAQVAAMVGEFLDIPSFSIIKKVEFDGSMATVDREVEGGKEIINVSTPFVAGCAEGVAAARIPNMRGIMSARTKRLEVIAALDSGQSTRIIKYDVPAQRSTVKIIPANDVGKLVELLHSEAKVI
jgi:electron transfer flavoprotein beta subunit